MYALADCNNFYASCEKAFNPKLHDKPVVVLSNNDGCVIALSNEAKALGITMGVPHFQVEALCRKHGVVARSSNYELYGDMSARVMETLAQLAPQVEVYSIDEAFLDFDNLAGVDVQKFARHIRETVTRNAGIPISIGMGKTKTLAKAANRYAKRHTPDFNWAITDEIERERILRWMATSDVWGIGSRISRRLSEMGIHDAWEFANMPSRAVKDGWNVTLQRVLWELQGTRCYGIEAEKPKKEIICGRAFGKVIYDLWELEQAIAKYVSRAAEKLRKQQGYTQHIRVRIEGSNRFKDNRPWEYETIVGLNRPTSNTGEMIRACTAAAWRLYCSLPKTPNRFDRTSGIRKAEVKLIDITWAGEVQGELFIPLPSERSEKLMNIMDAINRRHGSGTVFHAAQGIEPRWKMRRELKSPCYTTRLSDIPVVYAG